jgi:pimeloyl-ACP methyl ester carboxylesterase
LGLAARQRAKAWRGDLEARLSAGSTVLQTARGPIEYAEAGQGAPVLVFHGTPGGYDQTLAVMRLLDTHGLRIIAPSRPGYLRTPLHVGTTPEAQADAMMSLIYALNIEQVAVIGASGGGPAAVQFALRFRQRVSRLVLWEAATQDTQFGVNDLIAGPLSTDTGAWMMVQAARRFPKLAAPADARGNAARQQQAMQLMQAGFFPLALRREGILNDAEQIRNLQPLPLSEIHVPALLVHGTADASVPFAQSELAAYRLPNARLFRVRDGTHTSTFFSEEANATISQFLKQRTPMLGP